MDIYIREADKSEVDAICENVVEMAYDSQGVRLNRDVVKKAVGAVFERPELGFYVLAVHDKEIVGTLFVTFEWSDWRNGVYWWFQSVYVRPDWRRQGICRELFDYVRDKAREDPNVVGVNLYTHQHNASAIKAYRKIGMKESPFRIYYAPDIKSLADE